MPATPVDEFVHVPVLLRESVELLVTAKDGTYVDGTIGGGGHAAEILKRLNPRGRLFGFDADARAIEECARKLKPEIGTRLTLVNENFSRIGEWLAERSVGAVNGVLLDLGVSSFQLDAAAGFSYRSDSPLDMRFRRGAGISAKEIVNGYSVEELAAIFRTYGEEPHSGAIARAIVKRRQKTAIETTAQLRDAIVSVVPERLVVKPLSRIFQALRIAVNDELGVLKRTLPAALDALATGGRIVVIAYHSLEDRVVKEFFRHEALSCVCPPRTPLCVCGKTARVKIITRKALAPEPSEIRANPRARSAKLRAAQKTA